MVVIVSVNENEVRVIVAVFMHLGLKQCFQITW
jgi:hypothetical protein